MKTITWNPEIAVKLAARENIALTPDHWEVINLLRSFYQKTQRHPTMRALIKEINLQVGFNKFDSAALFKLFPQGPIQQGSRIGGLPKPAHCL